MRKQDQKLLKKLRKDLRNGANNVVAPEPIVSKELTFSELMHDVRRLTVNLADLSTPRKRIHVKPYVNPIEYDYFYVGDHYEDSPKQHTKNGQGNRDIQKLLQRTYPVISTLDLHGQRLEGLEELLTEFCYYVQTKGVCGRIVHGSGLGSRNSTPILKNKVRNWLYEYPEVLAYVEEQNNDGAVLILLKRKDPF